jgi:flavin reductase (DIM6/NTAB) family NADH-FMN oxidoreductase RutF
MFATAVPVIVARAGEEVLAMTVDAVSSHSQEPMRVMRCAARLTLRMH